LNLGQPPAGTWETDADYPACKGDSFKRREIQYILALIASTTTRLINFLAGGPVRREALQPVHIVPFGRLVLIALAEWGLRNLLSENLAT